MLGLRPSTIRFTTTVSGGSRICPTRFRFPCISNGGYETMGAGKIFHHTVGLIRPSNGMIFNTGFSRRSLVRVIGSTTLGRRPRSIEGYPFSGLEGTPQKGTEGDPVGRGRVR